MSCVVLLCDFMWEWGEVYDGRRRQACALCALIISAGVDGSSSSSAGAHPDAPAAPPPPPPPTHTLHAQIDMSTGQKVDRLLDGCVVCTDQQQQRTYRVYQDSDYIWCVCVGGRAVLHTHADA